MGARRTLRHLAVLLAFACLAACRVPVTTPTPTPRTVFVIITATPAPSSSPLATATTLPSPTSTPTPGGPAAEIAPSMPASIPCERWSGDKCWWNYRVSFADLDGIGATVERVGQRYVDREGRVWMARSGEWSPASIAIPPHGAATYDSWVRDAQGVLMGGTVLVSYMGHDANGNPFSGSVMSSLDWPEWPTFTPPADAAALQ